ncbi:DEAD/DEAH box helicase family protein [Pontixanthobacter luteolus]|uniref:DEAD/DEAH box helicase family protein n=1 Tax=Pontixanthobacter luteolus TaxID=295089 RepID=UPI002302EBEF|nr:DEAD/DEAH box helicase family protein [Pontixanthobacter luteolus]
MIELKVFQSKSSKLISDRFGFFANHVDRPSKGQLPRPFFQALSALTGAGKTPILADAVTRIRAHLGAEPIVLWMSKARSVIGQTHSNFSIGGKYSHLIEDFRTVRISDVTPDMLADGSAPLLITTTTALFNNKEQAEGNLHIYKTDKDKFGDLSPWERLIRRETDGVRRPLVIVYDEGHNLSEQQAEILSELEPDGYLLASATLRLPENFTKSVVNPIRLWVEEAEDAKDFAAVKALGPDGDPAPDLFVTTSVDSDAVVKAELVKLALQFDGTTAAMDRAIDELLERREILQSAIDEEGADLVPKAIYVCKTNITDEGTQDDPSLPFAKRQAPPIRIWRYLVETKGISPTDIAIYANLKFEKGAKPDELNLFSKGESDFEDFTSSDFQHIIFNLSLQEGWDDPSCYLAYIDKSMGSTIQVEQIMGRVLRQPKVRHYQSPLLNTAHFFVRVDRESVFSETLEKVKTKLKSEGAPLSVTSNFGGKGKASESVEPRDVEGVELHEIFVDSEAARKKIEQIIDDYPIFAEGDLNTIADARTASATVEVAGKSSADGKVIWSVAGHTNPVRLRWFVHTALKARSSRALAIADLKDQKFDVRVQVQSKADKLAESLAKDITDAFYSLAELVYESSAPFVFGANRAGKGAVEFSNSLYPKYAGLNKFELPFATAMDETNLTWHRNPVGGGFFIPLLSEGDTAKFYPDFLVWKDGLVYCLDTKGGHLLTDAVARKLFDIQEDQQTKLLTRFISEGKQEKLQGACKKGGYTVWKLKNGNPTPSHFDTLADTVDACLS